MINDRDLQRVVTDFRHGIEVAVLIMCVETHKRLEQIGDLLEIDSESKYKSGADLEKRHTRYRWMFSCPGHLWIIKQKIFT